VSTTGYKFALCSEVYRTPIEETIRRVAAIGFDGLEIAPFNVASSVDDVPPQRRAELRRIAAGEGLEIIGLHWLLVSPPGLHLTTPDAAVRRRTVSYLRSLARFAAELGGGFLVLGSPKQRNLQPGDEPRAAFERAAAGLREVAAECRDSGVRLLLEPLNPAETTFLRTVEEALELRQAIDSPAVGYILDVKAMSGMPEGIPGTLARHGAGAGHFHANEPGGKGPGMGALDFRPIIAALKASGYRGWVSTEPFDYAPDADTVARAALRTLREAAA
jgi:sugar phosphate isomerase/epimerase